VHHFKQQAPHVQEAVAMRGTVISPAAHVIPRDLAAADCTDGASQTKLHHVSLAKAAATVTSEVFQKFVDSFNARGRFHVSDAAHVK
jgi:hypothetical protein